MRILFIGAVEFSRHCLKEILKNGGQVVGVLTLEKEYALSQHADYADLSPITLAYRIPLVRVRQINDPGTIRRIPSFKPDLICIFGWSRIVARPILEIPRLGCIGSHPALLPLHRGRHPIIWSLVEGLEESGLTFFYLDEGIDSGDILWQRSFPIGLEDDAASVYEKIKQLASIAIAEFLPQLEQGCAPRIPQDHQRATYWRKRNEEDGQIHWEWPTIRIYNLIRALSPPYGGAHGFSNGKKMVIWRSRLPEGPLPPEASALPPGSIFFQTEEEFRVRTGDGYLRVLEYQ